MPAAGERAGRSLKKRIAYTDEPIKIGRQVGAEILPGPSGARAGAGRPVSRNNPDTFRLPPELSGESAIVAPSLVNCGDAGKELAVGVVRVGLLSADHTGFPVLAGKYRELSRLRDPQRGEHRHKRASSWGFPKGFHSGRNREQIRRIRERKSVAAVRLGAAGHSADDGRSVGCEILTRDLSPAGGFRVQPDAKRADDLEHSRERGVPVGR